MDPHWFESLDPDPYIEIKSLIRNRIRIETNADTQHWFKVIRTTAKWLKIFSKQPKKQCFLYCDDIKIWRSCVFITYKQMQSDRHFYSNMMEWIYKWGAPHGLVASYWPAGPPRGQCTALPLAQCTVPPRAQCTVAPSSAPLSPSPRHSIWGLLLFP